MKGPKKYLVRDQELLAVLVYHVWFGHALRSSGWDRECHNGAIIGGEMQRICCGDHTRSSGAILL